MLELLAIVALVVLIFVSIFFFLSISAQRDDIADVMWGMGFIVIVLTLLFLEDEGSVRIFVVSTLVTIWGARLTTHIYRRYQRTSEDVRYQELRAKRGNSHGQRFLKVFLLQGVLMILVSMSIIALFASQDDGFSPINVVGIFVWLFGFFYEVVGDAELAAFKKDPANAGKLMMTGLRRFTRYPSYFGEVTLWWGIFLVTWGGANPWIAVIGPLTITILILKVSGIPMLEKKMQQHPDYSEYKRKTSLFVPLPNRK